MASETEGYERPTRYAPEPVADIVMCERDRLSLRDWREAEEAEEQERQRPSREAERKRAERIAELQEEQQSTLRQLRAIERQRIATGKDEDAFQIDPATVGESAAVPKDKLNSWHGAQMTEFLANNPTYFRCKENEDAMVAYLERNAPGLKLVSAAQLTAAYRRLRDLGLLREKPLPVVKPMQQPVEHTVAPKQPSEPTGPQTFTGRDYETGLEREFTAREVDRMSSDEYRRAFPVLDNVKDLFATLSDERG